MNDLTIEPATPGDLLGILELLRHSGLPTQGLADHLADTLVVRNGPRVVAAAALERYTDGDLLRSVVVEDALRGSGIGRRLTLATLERARQHGAREVFLLTTTAEQYFPKFGFSRVDRAEVPESVRQSVEFTAACPASAVVMRKTLRPTDRAGAGEPSRIA